MKPTYLYIKEHYITGLKYFGKTYERDPKKYLGSGIYWKNHIRKHGKEFVRTTWSQLFTDENELVEFATNFSIQNNIVESKEWANLKIENGLDGGMEKGWWTEEQLEKNRQSNLKYYKDHPEKIKHLSKKAKDNWNNLSDEEKKKRKEQFLEARKLSTGSKGKNWKLSEETKKKQSKPKSENHKLNISKSLKGKKNGENNPCYGTIWITNEIITMKINKTDVIPNGWRPGRAFKERKKKVN